MQRYKFSLSLARKKVRNSQSHSITGSVLGIVKEEFRDKIKI
jgi:hypothetical protein